VHEEALGGIVHAPADGLSSATLFCRRW
jgi:hypothetical protein